MLSVSKNVNSSVARNKIHWSVFLSSNSSPAKPEEPSDDSIISEHLASGNESVENDRSLQEIEISNILDDLSSEVLPLSQETKPPSLTVSDSSASVNRSVVMEKDCASPSLEVKNNVQSILEEILRNEQFTSDVENMAEQSGSSSQFRWVNLPNFDFFFKYVCVLLWEK